MGAKPLTNHKYEVTKKEGIYNLKGNKVGDHAFVTSMPGCRRQSGPRENSGKEVRRMYLAMHSDAVRAANAININATLGLNLATDVVIPVTVLTVGGTKPGARITLSLG